jgi:hypothetical protein
MELLAVLQMELSKDQRMAIVSSGSPGDSHLRCASALEDCITTLPCCFALLLLLFMLFFYATIDAINDLLALPGVPLEDAAKLQKLE